MVSAVVGYGFRNHVLHIDIDMIASNRETIQKTLEALLLKYPDIQYEFSFVARKIKHFTTKSGENITNSKHAATLGCFAKSGRHLYALTSEHIRWNSEETTVKTPRNGKVLGHIEAYSKEYDIAAIKVDPNHECETTLRNEKGKPLTVACPVWEGRKLKLPLPVYLYGAVTSPGYGKLVIDERTSTDYSATYLVIENETDRDFCESGDSGSIVIARPNHKTYLAIGMLQGSFVNNSKPNGMQRSSYMKVYQCLKVSLEDRLKL